MGLLGGYRYLKVDDEVDPRQDPLDSSDTLNLDGTYVTIFGSAINDGTQRIRVTRENDSDNGNSTLADAIAYVEGAVARGLDVDEFSRARMDATDAELREERQAVENLL